MVLLTFAATSLSASTVPAPWGAPNDPAAVLDGVVSRNETHEGPASIDSGRGLFYFTRSNSDFTSSRVWMLPLSGGSPSVASFSIGPYDAGAAIDPAGATILFTSKRATNDERIPDEWNLWSAAPGASEAKPLPPPVNTKASECCAAYDPDGSFLFSSNRDGSWDIFRARRSDEGWSVTKLGGTINSVHDEWPSHVSRNGSLVLFSSIRPGGPGGDDVFAACPDAPGADRWQAQRLAAPINSEAYEDGAMITPDGRTLLWSSWRARTGGKALADVYAIDVERAGIPTCR